MTLSSRPKRRQEERTAAFVEQAAAVDTEQLHCLIPADLHRRLRVLAAEERSTITSLVVAAIEGILRHGRNSCSGVLMYTSPLIPADLHWRLRVLAASVFANAPERVQEYYRFHRSGRPVGHRGLFCEPGGTVEYCNSPEHDHDQFHHHDHPDQFHFSWSDQTREPRRNRLEFTIYNG